MCVKSHQFDHRSGRARSLSCQRLDCGTDMGGQDVNQLGAKLGGGAAGLRSVPSYRSGGSDVSRRWSTLDAVRVDFAAGAVEQVVMRWQQLRPLQIEGQGSLHPGSAATLPLLRGTQPTSSY